MHTYLKAQAALILGSIADFSTTIVLVRIFHCWYIHANATGNIIGGTVQFILSRNWAFDANKDKVPLQAMKFILVWVGNILLSAIGVWLLTDLAHVDYILSKLIVSIFLGLTYNYFFQKIFVFA